MGRGQELYNRAKEMIPGGTQLLSKRPEMFLPDLWPAYYSKAKGCEVWDLDENHYYDMSILVRPIHPKEEIQIVLKRYLEKIVLHFYKEQEGET